NDQQKTIPRLELKFTTDDSDEIELTKNQNIELDLICDLQNCSIIALPNEQHLTIKSSE
ncbi:9816_t:CDS:1, partial [Funneliformis geosporum]